MSTGLMSYDASFESIGLSPELASRFDPAVFASGLRTFLDTNLDLNSAVKVAQTTNNLPKLDFLLDTKAPTSNPVAKAPGMDTGKSQMLG